MRRHFRADVDLFAPVRATLRALATEPRVAAEMRRFDHRNAAKLRFRQREETPACRKDVAHHHRVDAVTDEREGAEIVRDRAQLVQLCLPAGAAIGEPAEIDGWEGG